MRLWSLHPKYLDPKGLVALWREALLGKAVLEGQTKGYKNHPQLERFKAHPHPTQAINAYLAEVRLEALRRGYTFDPSKVGEFTQTLQPVAVNRGQLEYEWAHLLSKLEARAPQLFIQWKDLQNPELHPLFELRPGPVEPWEKVL